MRRFVVSVFLVAAVLLGFSVRAAVISSFSPLFGAPGNVITINGSGFTGATILKFNDALADFDFISDTRLTAVIPAAGTTGSLRVTVGGTEYASSSSFSVAPRIDSFSPGTGSPGVVVVISGANFVNGGTVVKFAGTNAVVGTVTAPNQVTATVPVGATNGPIIVATAAGSFTSTNNFVSTYAPSITDFSPTLGTNGTTVTINGANFINGFTTVKFNGTNASSVTVVSYTQLSARVQTGASTGPITVTTPYGTFTTSSNFITGSQALITDFSPTAGAYNTAVNINGFNFTGATGVTIGGHAASVSSIQPNQIQAFVPVGATNGPITVTTPQGTGTSTAIFLAGNGPTVTDFSPVLGAAGTLVTINGFDLAGVTTVKFNNTVATSFAKTSDTQIQALVPAGATTGPIRLGDTAVTNSTSTNFTVTTAAPVITGFDPQIGVRGTTVRIYGANFTNLTSIKFNGTNATVPVVTSTSQMDVAVPADATTGPISITTTAGGTTNSTLFYLQPRITSFTPASGIVNSTITINGRSLTNASAVEINGMSYNFSVNSSTQLVATIPTNATTGVVKVTTPGGVIYSTNTFAVVPKIYSFNPTLGPTNTVVTIAGTSFSNVTSVAFSNATASFSILSGQQIQASVPNGAITGPIKVTTPDGSDTTTSNFTVTSSSQLILSNVGTPTVLRAGSLLTYTLKATNAGPSIVTSTKIVDTLPLSVTFLNATSSIGTCTRSNNVVTCDVGVLTNLTQATLTITVTPTNGEVIYNNATVSSAEPDLAIADNSAIATNYVLSDAQLTLKLAPFSASSGAVISWPTSVVNLLLQYSTNLNPTNPWLAVTNLAVTNNGKIFITNTPLPSQIYYRLKYP